MKEEVKQIDLDNYFAIAKLIFDDLDSISVYHVDGDLLWSSENVNELIDKGVKHISKLRNENNNNSNFYYIKLNKQKSLAVSIVEALDGRMLGEIAISFCAFKDRETVQKQINTFTNILIREILLIKELDSMSSELEERYEELNLVYHADEQSVQLSSGPEVLEKLVENCTEYLDVAMAALICPKEELTIFNIKSDSNISYVHSLLNQFKQFTYRYMEKNAMCVVSNNLDDEIHQKIFYDIPYKVICCPIYTEQDRINGILVILNPSSFRDFTNSDRNLLEAMAKKAGKITIANYDSLSGLFNTNSFEFYMQKRLEKSYKEGTTYCLLHIDLDGLKVVNESHSNSAGDYVILEVAKLLRDKVRDSDLVARINSDKFCVLLDSCSVESGCTIADSICKVIDEYAFKWREHSLHMTCCIGISEINADSDNIDSVIAAAELATSIAKENGRGIVQVYQQTDTVLARRKDEIYWIREIQRALKNNQFQLYAQPIAPINDSSLCMHYELLLRMFDSEGTTISPIHFIEAAERYRLITNIDEWVVENAFKSISENIGIANNFLWTMNLSGFSIEKSDFAKYIIETNKKYNLSPDIICFELTETFTMNNLEEAKNFIEILSEYGFKFALDDFGTGASTFTYLRELPVHYLKIDGSFIKEIASDSFAGAIVKSINDISHVRNLQTIAEYVESKEIMQCVTSMGIDFAQGYEIGKPAPLEDTIHNLASGSSQLPGKDTA